MMFIGYLYGIRSERKLEQEVQLNMAYRWFIGLGLTDRVPDHSTLSLNRKRFQGTTVVWRFTYDVQQNIYVSPQKHELNYSTTDREGYRQYKSDPKVC